jgi:hypothetical protein
MFFSIGKGILFFDVSAGIDARHCAKFGQSSGKVFCPT